MKIGVKLFIGFSIIILLNAAVGLAVLNNLQAIERYDDNMRNMNGIVMELNGCRLTEKEFRSVYDPELVLGFQSHSSNLSSEIARLKNAGELYPGYDTEDLNEVRSLAQEYRNLILTNSRSTDNVENLWLTEQDILTRPGGLDESSSEIKNSIAAYEVKKGSTQAMSYLYTIQQLEKSLILSHNASVLSEINVLEDRLMNATGYDSGVSKAVNRYNDNLRLLLFIDDRRDNVEARIDDTVMRLETGVTSLNAGVSQAYRNTVSQTQMAVVSLVVLSLIFSIIISLAVTVSISRPIEHLSKVSTDIAKGDLRKKIMIRGDDEIVRLADNFKKMIRLLRERIELNDTILRSMEDALIIMDEKSDIFYFNGPARDLTGYTFMEAMNKSPGALLGMTFSSNGDHYSGKDTMRHKDGRRIDISYRVTPLHDGDEKRIGTMIMIRAAA